MARPVARWLRGRASRKAAALLAVWGSSALLAAPAPAPADGGFVVRGGVIAGRGPVAITVRDGRVVSLEESRVDAALPVHDFAGRFVVPGVIDSHIHLAFRFSAPELARGGVAAAVDLAAPRSFLREPAAPLRLIRAGPMLTAARGYPTQSWGRDGYGHEVDDAAMARRAVEMLHREGARVIKVPVGDATGEGAIPVPPNPAHLSDETLRAIVQRAHALGMRVAAHAITDAAAARAAAVGVDVLAHTPAQRLEEATVALWSGRAVISTLAAFAGRREPVENLRRLREAGTTVLYGTDMGYTDVAGIHPLEIERLVEAGLDGSAILRAATEAPAAFWGLDADLGALEIGRAASFLVLEADPTVDPSALAAPVAVYLDGVKQDGPPD